jgi:hypothetical protein
MGKKYEIKIDKELKAALKQLKRDQKKRTGETHSTEDVLVGLIKYALFQLDYLEIHDENGVVDVSTIVGDDTADESDAQSRGLTGMRTMQMTENGLQPATLPMAVQSMLMHALGAIFSDRADDGGDIAPINNSDKPA